MMVGRWVSFWDWLFLGAMLNFRGILQKKNPYTIPPSYTFPASSQPWPQKAVNVDIIELAGMLRGLDTMDAEGWFFGWLVGCLFVWLVVCLFVWLVGCLFVCLFGFLDSSTYCLKGSLQCLNGRICVYTTENINIDLESCWRSKHCVPSLPHTSWGSAFKGSKHLLRSYLKDFGR